MIMGRSHDGTAAEVQCLRLNLPGRFPAQVCKQGTVMHGVIPVQATNSRSRTTNKLGEVSSGAVTGLLSHRDEVPDASQYCPTSRRQNGEVCGWWCGTSSRIRWLQQGIFLYCWEL